MKPLLIVVSILAVISLGTIYFTQTNKTQPNKPQNSNINSVPSENTVPVTLRLVPEKTLLTVGEETMLNVFLEANGLMVIGVQTELIYLSDTIKILDITSGSFLKDAQEFDKVIDPQQGTLTYALGTLVKEVPTTQASIFSIKIKALAPTKDLESVIYFDRANTKTGLLSPDGEIPYLSNQQTILFEESPLKIVSGN